MSSLPQPRNPQELERVLAMTLVNDTQQLKQAGEILKVFLKKPSCVEPLIQQIHASNIPEARQSAAILLRRKIHIHWKKVSPQSQQEIKKLLLQRLINDPSRPVRLAVAALISAIAKKTVPDGQWNELLDFLLQASQSQNEAHREVSMLLFRALAENIGENLKPHFKLLQNIFKRGLMDKQEKVQIEALKAIGVLVEYLESDQEVVEFRDMIPPMVEVVKRFVAAENEEAAAVAFETFDTLADSPAPVLHAHIPLILPLMAEIVVNHNVDINIREKASLFICSFVEHKPGKVMKHNLVEPLLKCCFAMSSEPYEDVWEADDMTPQKMCVEILDACMIHLTKRLVYQPGVQQSVAMLSSSNPNERKGALVILAVMAEGCAELLRENLQPFVEAICKTLRDPSPLVRAAACVALTQFADHIQPEVTDFHQMVLPALFFALDNSGDSLTVKKKSCTALEVFCENLGSDITRYIEPLMKKLVELVHSNDVAIMETAVSAIRSCAKSAGDKFLPYYQACAKTMGQLMTARDDERLKLRAMATECLGAIAVAVGKDAFAPLLQDSLRLAIEGMKLEYFQLRESTHNFFASLALMLGPDFQPLLTTVVPLLLATLESDDGVVIHHTEDDDQIAPVEDSDEDEGDDDYKRVKLSIRSGALDEKVQALSTISTLMTAVGEPLVPFLDRIIPSLSELSEYPHQYVRQAVLNCFEELINLLYTVLPNQEKWQRGVAVAVHPQVQKVLTKVMPQILPRMTEEEDKTTTAAACECLVTLCRNFGLGAVQPWLNDIYKALGSLINEETPAQAAFDEDDPEAEDHDEVLIDSVTDLIGAVAAVVGPSFEPVFREMFPALMKFNQPRKHASDRAMAIGCIAEVAEEIGANITPYLDQIFPALVAGLRDKSVQLRRNSAYCAGVLCDVAAQQTSNKYREILQALQPIFAVNTSDKDYVRNKEHYMACRDNACSCIARMIKKAPQAVPLDVAVPMLLSGLPLVSDFQECKHVYPCLQALFNMAPQMMTAPQSVAHVVRILSQVLGNPNVPEELQPPLAVLAKQLASNPQTGKVVKEAMSKLPPADAQNLAKFLN